MMYRENKIKLVLMFPSTLNSRWMDFYNMDSLAEQFDLEYWDCSDIVYPSFRIGKSIERDYVIKIKSLLAFRKHLSELPSDTVVCIDVHLTWRNCFFHRILAKYFRVVNAVSFWDNYITEHYEEENNQQVYIPNNISFRQKIKMMRHRWRVSINVFYFCLTHPNRWSVPVNQFIERRIIAHYTRLNIIGAAPYQKWRINLPDVEKYFRIKDKVECNEKFVVFVDEYFPLHPDLKRFEKEKKLQSIKEPYYKSLNAFFKRVEDRFSCKVIIAAHPSSNYVSNPYEGRKLCNYMTAELIRDSMGVIMHGGLSVSFVLLFEKPLMLISNAATEQVFYFQIKIHELSVRLGAEVINTDNKDAELCFPDVDKKKRIDYLKTGLFLDNFNKEPNSILLPKYLNQIYKETYNNNNDK